MAARAESTEEERKEVAGSGRRRSAGAEEALGMGTDADSGEKGDREKKEAEAEEMAPMRGTRSGKLHMATCISGVISGPSPGPSTLYLGWTWISIYS